MQLQKLVDVEFFKAVEELTSQPVGVVLAYKLSDLLEKVKKERFKFESLRQTLISRYGEKDEAGRFKTNEAKTEYLLKDKEAFDKEYKDLTEIEVDLPKIKLSELEVIKISGKTMSQIKELLIP